MRNKGAKRAAAVTYEPTPWKHMGSLKGFMEAYKTALSPSIEQGVMSGDDANEIYKLIKEKCAKVLPYFSLVEVATYVRYNPTYAGADFYFSYKHFEVYNQTAGNTNFLYVRVCKPNRSI